MKLLHIEEKFYCEYQSSFVVNKIIYVSSIYEGVNKGHFGFDLYMITALNISIIRENKQEAIKDRQFVVNAMKEVASL